MYVAALCESDGAPVTRPSALRSNASRPVNTRSLTTSQVRPLGLSAWRSHSAVFSTIRAPLCSNLEVQCLLHRPPSYKFGNQPRLRRRKERTDATHAIRNLGSTPSPLARCPHPPPLARLVKTPALITDCRGVLTAETARVILQGVDAHASSSQSSFKVYCCSDIEKPYL